MICRIERKRELDRNAQYTYLDFDVQWAESASVQAINTSGTWTATKIGLYRSNNQVDWVALESPLGFSADGMTDVFETGFAWLRVQVDAAEGSAALADIIVCMKSRS